MPHQVVPPPWCYVLHVYLMDAVAQSVVVFWAARISILRYCVISTVLVSGQSVGVQSERLLQVRILWVIILVIACPMLLWMDRWRLPSDLSDIISMRRSALRRCDIYVFDLQESPKTSDIFRTNYEYTCTFNISQYVRNWEGYVARELCWFPTRNWVHTYVCTYVRNKYVSMDITARETLTLWLKSIEEKVYARSCDCSFPLILLLCHGPIVAYVHWQWCAKVLQILSNVA